MPLKLSVGLSRKIGQPDFGSVGASCNVEVELDPSLLRDDLDGFQRHVSNTFNACRQAVANELDRQQQCQTAQVATGNGQPRRNGTSNGAPRNGRQATAAQLRAIRAIASRNRLDLANELQTRFRVDRPDDLSISEASVLIDAIKSQTNSN